MSYNKHIPVEDTATLTAKLVKVEVKHILHLRVDGDDDIQFNFNTEVGAEGTFTLKPGESIEDIPIPVYFLAYKAKTNSSAFRFLGLN